MSPDEKHFHEIFHEEGVKQALEYLTKMRSTQERNGAVWWAAAIIKATEQLKAEGKF